MTVAGKQIPGGMIWLGTTMAHAHGEADPALLNPHLTVDSRPDWTGKNIDYWPSYTKITARQRCAYLMWLSQGRRAPGVPISYVFVFFYGLERRVLDAVDTRTTHEPSVLAELAVIQDEILALRDVYAAGDAESTYPQSSFDRYANALADLVGALILAAAPGLPPVPDRESDYYWQMPLELRVALGRMARDEIPVSAPWALAWVWYHPRIYARTPQRRCRAEFDALLSARYAARTGSGMRLSRDGADISVDYRCASTVSRSGKIELVGVPDVAEADDASQLLTELAESAENDLDPFSRWLGRHPEDRTSLGALATLPPELLETVVSPELTALRLWADTALVGQASAVTDSRPLIRIWGDATKFPKLEAVAAANLLQKLGYGIEPDARCGSPALTFGSMVIFRANADTPQTAGQTYAAATLIAHLGVVVAAADGHVDDVELAQITYQLQSALDLTAGEHQRLAAHITWLVATGVKLTGLKKRLDPLTVPERETLANFVADVAAADGVITAAESKALDQIHTLLGLDPAGAARRLHDAMTTHTAAPPATNLEPPPGPTPDEPITVRAGFTTPPDHPLPPHPKPGPTSLIYGRPDAPDSPAAAAPDGFCLDENVIAVRRADTANVAALLTRIFSEKSGDDAPSAETGPDGRVPVADQSPLDVAKPSSEGPLSVLTGAYRALLGELSERTVWYRVEFDRLAAGQGLIPDEARDGLNAAASAVAGREVLSGVERLYVDEHVLAKLVVAGPPLPADQPPQCSDYAVTTRETGAVPVAVTQHADDAGRPGALDATHRALLEGVAAQSHWYRVEFEQMATELGLLPDAALETLNDCALDLCDDLLLDGAEQLTVDQVVLKEMLR